MLRNWTTKRLQTVVICGCLLGISVPFGAMIFHENRAPRAEAAVLVYDAKNVAEAIKTAITTADILTNEQKQLALMLLDAKKFDKGVLMKWLAGNEEAQQITGQVIGWLGKRMDVWGVTIDPEVVRQMGKSPAILNQKSTTGDILIKHIGSINTVLDKNRTLVDPHLESSKNHRVLDSTYQAAAARAQTSQKVTESINKTINEALERANNAEGESQILQAQTAILAASVLQNADEKDLLANLLAAQAEKYYVENREKALQETAEQRSKDGLKAFAGLK